MFVFDLVLLVRDAAMVDLWGHYRFPNPISLSKGDGREEKGWIRGCRVVTTYRNLEIHHFIRDGAHLIIEAEAVFAHFIGSEDKVALPLFFAFHNPFLVRSVDAIVDIEGAAGLHLCVCMLEGGFGGYVRVGHMGAERL